MTVQQQVLMNFTVGSDSTNSTRVPFGVVGVATQDIFRCRRYVAGTGSFGPTVPRAT